MCQAVYGNKINFFFNSILIDRIFIAQINPRNHSNWIYTNDYDDMAPLDLYITSFYFTVTTIMTVGYGDITA